jgi:hypothetical protein
MADCACKMVVVQHVEINNRAANTLRPDVDFSMTKDLMKRRIYSLAEKYHNK